MKISKNKTTATFIALILMTTIITASIMSGLPVANALIHTESDTHAFITRHN